MAQKQTPHNGMKCKHIINKVLDSRLRKGYTHNKQRRECLECGERYFTYTLTEKEIEHIKTKAVINYIAHAD